MNNMKPIGSKEDEMLKRQLDIVATLLSIKDENGDSYISKEYLMQKYMGKKLK